MSMEIKAMEPRDNKRQVAFFALDGQEFSCGNVPVALTKTEDIQAYLNGRADEFKLLLLKREYPESDHKRFQKVGKTELKAMNEWISNGHRNKIQIGLTLAGNPKYGYEVIEKQELQYRHPKSIKLSAMIDSSTVVKEVKDLLKEIVK